MDFIPLAIWASVGLFAFDFEEYVAFKMGGQELVEKHSAFRAGFYLAGLLVFLILGACS